MPRYFTNLYNSEVLCDERGQVFQDLAAARLAAQEAISELIGEHISRGNIVDLNDRLEVVDEDGCVQMVLRYADFFRGTGTAPLAS